MSDLRYLGTIALAFILPAMFLACPEEPPPSPVLFEPTVYGAP